jgi:hypothetical protein
MGDEALGSLTIPPWVPDAVAIAARALNSDLARRGDHQYREQYREVLTRILTDLRMRRVWVELLKQTRDSSRTFQYPAIQMWDCDNAADRQNIAIASLLYYAVNLVMDDPTLMTGRQVETQRHKALDEAKAAYLQGDFTAIRDHETKAAGWAAAATTRLVVDRDTGDAQARCFAILFADQCRRLFGSPLYGVTATVTSVALGRKFSRRTIRGWVS